MSNIEKEFDSVAASQKWLSSLELEQGQHVKVTITGKDQPAATKTRKRKFSETALCGLWKDRQDVDDVAAYVRQIRKPRFTTDVS